MADFEPAFTNTMKWEDPKGTGEVTHDPSLAHPEAVARFGINSAANPDVTADGFYSMTYDEALEYAANLYRNTYWAKVCGSQVNNQSIANKYFDLAVNEGWVEATKITQRALSLVLGLPIVCDGICGPQTIAAINSSDSVKLLASMRQQATAFYQALVAAHPQDQPDLKGWEIRANS